MAGWPLRAALAAVAVVLSGPWAAGQAVDAVAARATAMRTTETIRVDGRLDEPAWHETVPLSRFVQREPVEGGEPSEETEIRVLFTDTALYIGAVCHDRSPREIVATQLSRDADLDVDDRLTIVLDPFFDHRNGFFFQVNAAGARTDGQVSNNAESLSRDWDGIWNAVVRITDEGWIAEIEIPFKTLRFKPGQSQLGLQRRTADQAPAGDRSVDSRASERLDQQSGGGRTTRRPRRRAAGPGSRRQAVRIGRGG